MSTVANIGALLMEDTPPQTEPISLRRALGTLVDKAEAGEPIIHTIPVGLDLLDGTSGGLVRGEYLGIVAGPGAGKSTFGDGILLQALQRKSTLRALVFALETSVLVRCARLLAGFSVKLGSSNCIEQYLSVGRLLRGELDDRGKVLARQEGDKLSQLIGDRLEFVDDVYEAGDMARLITDRRADIVLVDHMGLVSMESLGNSSAVECFDAALKEINNAIRQVNAAGILITEVSKAGLISGAADLTAVRGSARFASLAGAIIGIVRDEEHIGDDPRLLFQLHKNRHGQAFMQQPAIFFGGMSYLSWGMSERMGWCKPKPKGKKNVK